MKKISISLSGHQTSITLEPEFIDALHALAVHYNKPVAQIINEIDAARAPDTNLSSAVRVWILNQMILRTGDN
ncbi:MAG: ribbon-helix-helix domain-containing protein [Alphaproteobacteria bacterium]|nr:ribbon-helix-helix domain-containing protein [Alphaproteobacteria bacterium]